MWTSTRERGGWPHVDAYGWGVKESDFLEDFING